MTAPTIRILISSPSDVSEERLVAKKVVQELVTDRLLARSCRIEPYFWEEQATPGVGLDAQAVVNSSLFPTLNDAVSTIAVCILWTRLGTPTRYCASGTVEEVLRTLIAAGEEDPKVLFYHGNRPIPPNRIEVAQLQGVRTFRLCFSNFGGLAREYESLVEFESLIRQHLRESVGELTQQPDPASGRRAQSDNIVNFARQVAADLRDFGNQAKLNTTSCLEMISQSASIGAILEQRASLKQQPTAAALQKLFSDFVADIDRKQTYTPPSLAALRKARILIAFSPLLTGKVQEHLVEVQRTLKMAVSALKRQAETVIHFRASVIDQWPPLLLPIPPNSILALVRDHAEQMVRLEAEMHAVERLAGSSPSKRERPSAV